MPLVTGGALTAVLVVLIIMAIVANRSSGLNTQPVADIHCDSGEQLAVHYHAHVDLIYNGTPVAIPAGTGITSSCFYWMHTHQTSGIIHMEAPKDSANRQFTLGDFFAVWRQPITGRQIATIPVQKGDQVKVWVDGKPYSGDPAKVVLKSHEQVVVEWGTTFVDPPTFDWTSQAAVAEAGSGG